MMSSALAEPMREAPNFSAAPVNQLAIAGNACGPAALLAAFRFGSPKWQRAADAVRGETDRQRLGTIIREIAMRPSNHLVGRPRWSKAGVNVADLCDIGNEMATGHGLDFVGYEVLVAKPGESREELLKRVHKRLDKSLAKGLPPVVSIRRFAERKSGAVVVEGHFVTVIAVPEKLEKAAQSFPVSYLDPWGGKRCEGRIAISDRSYLADACLEARFPQALVGKSKLKAGEGTALAVSAVVGRL